MVELRRGAGRLQDAGYRRRRSEVSLNIAVRGARAAEDGEAVSDVVFHAEQAAVVVDIGVFPGLSDIAAAIRSFGNRHSRAREEWPGRRVFRRGHNSIT
jgi:hypothetical protein